MSLNNSCARVSVLAQCCNSLRTNIQLFSVTSIIVVFCLHVDVLGALSCAFLALLLVVYLLSGVTLSVSMSYYLVCPSAVVNVSNR